MRQLLVVFSFLIHFALQAQTYEAGLVLGGTNFVGDVGSTSFIKPKDYLAKDKIAVGFIFKWNRSPRHAFRFSYINHKTFGFDKSSESLGRKQRGLTFNTTINEVALGLEFNFWEWDLHANKRPQTVPYLSTGINLYSADKFILNNSNNTLLKQGKNYNFALPLILGVKTTLTEKLILAAEFGARYSFSDNLDGSSPVESGSANESQNFGNENMNDWYIFGGITLTYAFGRKPCYCKF